VTDKTSFNTEHPEVKPSRSAIKGHLDATASASMLASRRIFLAKECKEWNPSFYYCGTVLWNNLKSTVTEATTLLSFHNYYLNS